MPQNQGSDLGNTDDQSNVEAATEHDCIIAQVEKPHLTFDELMSTPIDFSAYVMNNLKIDNLTQEHLVGPAFNLLKGTCRRQEYPFDLSKPLSLIEVQGRQVVPVDYFINKDLEYLKGGSSSRKYTTCTTKTKVVKYDDIQGIKDMHDVFSSKRIIAVTYVKAMKWYDYGYLEEIKVQREDKKLYKFKEGDFPRLNMHDIEGMLLLLVQKKIANLERDVIFDLNVALRMFTRHKYKRNRLMRSDELYEFNNGMLTSVRSVLHDIASNLRMNYLPKRRWCNIDKQRYRIMIEAINKLQLERRLMRSLEKFIGGREYGEDFRLLEQTI
ncbi:hypothetical protein Tco_1284141 [Tanacetum coccineum]